MKNKKNLNKYDKKRFTSIITVFFQFALALVLVLAVFSVSASALEAPRVKIFLFKSSAVQFVNF